VGVCGKSAVLFLITSDSIFNPVLDHVVERTILSIGDQSKLMMR